MHPISEIVLYTTEHRSYHQLKCSFISLLPAVFHASFQTAQRRKIKAMALEHINLSLCTSLIFFALIVVVVTYIHITYLLWHTYYISLISLGVSADAVTSEHYIYL